MIYSRVGIRAAYEIALESYGDEQSAIESVASALCITEETVREALQAVPS